MRPHEVAIVMDGHFGPRLRALAQRMHTWIVGTPENRQVADEIWAEHSVYSLKNGVTWVNTAGHNSHESMFRCMLDSVDDHHGEFCHDPPWSVLHIYGIPLNPAVRQALADLGATGIAEHEDHFTASRQLNA